MPGKLLLVVMSYVIGSIPVGLIISKIFYKVDIREQGSGNTGATNVWRVLGKKPGMVTLFLDIVKGLLPVVIAKNVHPEDETLHMIVGFAAIAGHNWSLFLRFQGGKGVATSAGAFLALTPRQMGLALMAFIIGFISSGRVSVGSVIAAITLFGSIFIFNTAVSLKILISIVALIVIIKHIPNMKRIAQGTEPKIKLR